MYITSQKHLQDNDPKHTGKLCQRYIKSKEEQHVFQWTYILLNYCGMKLTQNSKLNNLKVPLSSDNSRRKAEQNYFQSTSCLWWNLWNGDSDLREFLASFWFAYFVFNVAQENLK